MDVGKKDASIFIDISHPDLGIQELFFEQFKEFKKILEGTLNEEWIWELHTTDEHGKVISRIYKQLQPVSIFEQTDWPAIISFLKPRIMGLDEFWSMVKDSFEALK